MGRTVRELYDLMVAFKQEVIAPNFNPLKLNTTRFFDKFYSSMAPIGGEEKEALCFPTAPVGCSGFA